MYTFDELKTMTVAQLRKYAKEQGIDLPTGMLKASVIEAISKRLNILENAATEIVESEEQAYSRNVRILSDDFDDEPVMTVNRSRILSEGSEGQSMDNPSARSAQTTPKPNKPAFNLQGAKAWHNPQPYFQQQQNKYMPAQSQAINTAFGGQQGMADARQYAPRPSFNRFGPEISSDERQQENLYTQSHFVQAPVKQAVQHAGGAQAFSRTGNQGGYSARVGQSPARGGYGAFSSPQESSPQETLMASMITAEGAGVLEIMAEGHGILKPQNAASDKEFIYVSAAQIRRFALRSGDFLEGKIRPQREGDKYAAMLYIVSINGEDTELRKQRPSFEALTATLPQKRIGLSSRKNKDLNLRLLDVFSPLGFGSRAMLQYEKGVNVNGLFLKIAGSLEENYPEVHKMLLLADAKPETICEIRKSSDMELFSNSFYDSFEKQIHSCDLAVERAMRLAESGQDVVLMINGFDAICRAYDNSPALHARELASPVSEQAFKKALRLLGIASSFKEGGSITVISAVCLNQENQKLIEGMKEYVNAQLYFKNAEDGQGIFDILQSSTVEANELRSRDENSLVDRTKRLTASKKESEVLEFIVSIFNKTETNKELCTKFDSWMQMLEDH